MDRCCEVAVLERPRTAERYVRAVAAAVAATACLLLAATTGGPARSADEPPRTPRPAAPRLDGPHT
ncbi:hypothetical protein [Streptomyces sp. NPDC090994]|uniref:hypothetical protein n=1 Tax=Streptomyces sp. NPDC090994 TaxID=3365969 RepID=UPI00380396C5